MNSHWVEEKVFQTAKKITSAIFQHVVFDEWLPLVVGRTKYRGYKNNVNPGITNAFTTAAFRFGHSLIPNYWALLDKNFDKLHRSVTIQESFRNRQLAEDYGIETFMYGLAGNKSKEVDTGFAFSIARRLFVKPGKDEYHDLTARNIQRGRDHGVSTYGAYRRWCRLPEIKTWRRLRRYMPNKAVDAFKKLYKSPNDIDLFAAGIAERHEEHHVVGPTFTCIIRRQFDKIQHGDRLYYRALGMFTLEQRYSIYQTRMSTILCNNLKDIVSIQKHAFFTANRVWNRRSACEHLPKLNLKPWKERRHDEPERSSSTLNDLDDEIVSSRSRLNGVQEDSGLKVNGLIKEPGYNPASEEEAAFVRPPLEALLDETDDHYDKFTTGDQEDESSDERDSALSEYNLDPEVEEVDDGNVAQEDTSDADETWN